MKEVKIKKIKKLEDKFKLYDIETKNHNFYANDILVHNSNAGFSFNSQVGHWFQSRENIITVEKDNAACAFNGEGNLVYWMDIVHKLANFHNIDLHNNIITVFFEWGGGNIQKKSAVTGLDKLSYIFQHFKVSPIENIVDVNGRTTNATWHETYYLDVNDNKVWIDAPEARIYNTMNFTHWDFEIDFGRTSFAQNAMIELVEKTIEPNSPMGNKLGKENNVGEGIVVTFMYKDVLYRFKCKGEKHANSKVKTLKPVDTEKEQVKIDFANLVCTPGRLEQSWQKTFGIDNEIASPNVKETGTFIRYVVADVWKEESDIAFEKGIEPKDVNSLISKVSKDWFMSELDKLAGL